MPASRPPWLRMRWCLLLTLLFTRGGQAACDALMAREGDVSLHCTGAPPDWANVSTSTTGIEVRGAHLPQLGPDFLGGLILPQLLHLYLPRNQIRKVEANATAGLPNLLTLDLSHNKLETLEAGALAASPLLETLVLSHNNLLALADPDGSFLKGLPQLQHVQVRHCSLSSVPKGILQMLSTSGITTELDLRGNPAAAVHCHSALLQLQAEKSELRLICDKVPATVKRPPPAWQAALWCVLALVILGTTVALLWRCRQNSLSFSVPYQRFLHGTTDA